VNTNNFVKWRQFKVSKKFEPINNYLFLLTYIYRHLRGKLNNNIGVNEVRANDSETSTR